MWRTSGGKSGNKNMIFFLFLNKFLIFLSFRKISDDIVTADQRRENIGRKVRTHANENEE
jgi:hypothetical protein